MTSSPHDPPNDLNDKGAAVLSADGLLEILATLSKAPDLTAAAAYLLSQFGEIGGSSRGYLILPDAAQEMVLVTASLGLDEEMFGAASAFLADLDHPAVVSARSLSAVTFRGGSPEDARIPFGSWVAYPLPQAGGRPGAGVLPFEQAQSLLARSGACVLPPQERQAPWFGYASCGALVLESVSAPSVVDMLTRLALLAGPVVARAITVDTAQRSGDQLTRERDRLTLIVNSLPDPIVEVNNLLFTSFLARSVMAGRLASAPRELNLVDPSEGTDLLFEVIGHPLGGEMEQESAYLSVLRDVTDLRRAGYELEQQIQRVRLTEYEARRERDRLNVILENVADPILVTDDQSNIIIMNEEAERLFETPRGSRRQLPAHASGPAERHQVHVVHLGLCPGPGDEAAGADVARRSAHQPRAAGRGGVGEDRGTAW